MPRWRPTDRSQLAWKHPERMCRLVKVSGNNVKWLSVCFMRAPLQHEWGIHALLRSRNSICQLGGAGTVTCRFFFFLIWSELLLFNRWPVVQLALVEYSWITAERLLYSPGTRSSVSSVNSLHVLSPRTHFAEMSPFYIVIEVAIAVLSISGNILVCWAVAINTTLKNATNYFLVSLAVADILVGCLAIPFAITISLGIELDFYGCLFLACFVLVLTQSSIFSLLAIAIDRYLAVKIPLRWVLLIYYLWCEMYLGILRLMGCFPLRSPCGKCSSGRCEDGGKVLTIISISFNPQNELKSF